MSIVTRFSPSPTGYLHIGSARTALFNWAFARANNGLFKLRIEDTDRARSTNEAIQAIYDGMEWLGLDYDGDAVLQTENEIRHVDVAKQLLADGKAYKCYCTQDELAQMREEGHGYNRKWRDNDTPMPNDAAYTIRIKAPIEGSITVHDKVQGDVTIDASQLDDFIILRADRTPTYMLAVVVDDHDMGVTHVIRGDDHLNNAFRQKILIEALGWTVPIYAHIPLIHGDDGKKLSKRHGALSVMEYDAMGYLPEAMMNYLMRLGWSHGDDEIFTPDQIKQWFGLDGINKSPARLDFKKLNHINAHYIRSMDIHALTDLILNRFEGSYTDQQADWLRSGMDELRQRAETLNDLIDGAGIYLSPLTYDDPKVIQAIENGKEALQALYDAFSTLSDFSAESVEKTVKNIVDESFDGKYGKVGMPFRAAMTGRGQSPSVPSIAAAFGKEETLERLKKAIES